MAGITDLAMRILIGAEDRTGPVFKHAKDGIQSISDSLARVETLAKRFFDIRLFTGFSQQFVDIADRFKTLQARLKLVSDTTEEYNIAQQAVFEIAQRTRSSLEATANLYGKVETAVKQLGGTQSDALSITETLNNAIALTSQGAENDAAAILQFSQALGSGVLRGDEFNSVMENSPGLAKALADGLGVPITALRDMAQAGELTADRLINALGKAAPAVAQQFAQLPTTVGQALTQLNNAFTRYIGEADAASGVTAKLAASVQFAAENFKPLAETAVTLAAVYGVTLLQGLIKSGAAMLDSVVASRAKLAADRELLAGEIMLAEFQSKQAVAAAAAAKAAMQAATIARQGETAAIQAYYAAATVAAEKQAALAALTTKTAAAMTLAQRAAAGLNAALNLFIAFEIGKTIGEWLNQFQLVQVAGARLAQAFTIAAAAVDALFGDGKLDDLPAKVQQINAEYNDMVSRIGAVKQAETARAEVAQSTAQITENKLTNEIAYYKSLADAIKQAADERLQSVASDTTQRIRNIETTVTDAGGIDRSRARERQITQVMTEAAAERDRILARSTQEQVALLDQAHTKQVEAAKKANQSTQELDKTWLDSKFKVLKDWRSTTASTIQELIALEKKHRDAATQADADIANHRRDTAKLVTDLKTPANVEGVQDLSRLRGDAVLQKRDIAEARKTGDIDAELQAAKRVEQAYVDIAQKTKGLFDQGLVDQSALDIAVYDLQQAAKQTDDITAQQGEQQKQAAAEVTAAIEQQRATMADVDSQLNVVLEKAKQTLILNVDKTAVDAAKAAIDSIPTEKTVVIKTVTEGGAPVANDQSVPGFADGARLSGFGGGDRHPALLESGEGVINKYGMRSLDGTFGTGFFDGINAGLSPIALLRQRFSALRLAEGGRIHVNLPNVALNNAASGTPINIHLPGGQSFGPFVGSGDAASTLETALRREVLKRGSRA